MTEQEEAFVNSAGVAELVGLANADAARTWLRRAARHGLAQATTLDGHPMYDGKGYKMYETAEVERVIRILKRLGGSGNRTPWAERRRNETERNDRQH